MKTGYRTRWVRRELDVDDPGRIAIREALAFGKALYDRRTDLGLSTGELAQRAGMTQDEAECIEEGGTKPTLALRRRLAAAISAGDTEEDVPRRSLSSDAGRGRLPT